MSLLMALRVAFFGGVRTFDGGVAWGCMGLRGVLWASVCGWASVGLRGGCMGLRKHFTCDTRHCESLVKAIWLFGCHGRPLLLQAPQWRDRV